MSLFFDKVLGLKFFKKDSQLFLLNTFYSLRPPHPKNTKILVILW